MNALKALHSRVSAPRLTEPAPPEDVLRNIYKAALRAADHGLLRPWRFLVIRGEARLRLGDLFVAASTAGDAEIAPAKLESIRQKPLRAPLIVVTIASPKDHPKVPTSEQELSAACATQNMLLAAFAQGVGAMWRTGSMAYHPLVQQGLGLTENEKIVGFLYLGSVLGPAKRVQETDVNAFFQEW